MLSAKIQTLLDALPQNLEETGARHAFKRVALSLIAEPEQAVAVVEAIGRLEQRNNHDERLVSLLSSTLDEARMARENGKTAGASFITQLENAIQALKARDALTDPGRLFLASCWVRAGLHAPDALAGEFSMPDDMEAELDLSDAPDLEPLIDTLLEEATGDQMDSISALHSGFVELMATFPAPSGKPLFGTSCRAQRLSSESSAVPCCSMAGPKSVAAQSMAWLIGWPPMR